MFKNRIVYIYNQIQNALSKQSTYTLIRVHSYVIAMLLILSRMSKIFHLFVRYFLSKAVK